MIGILRTNILTRMGNLLGNSFSQLSFVNNIHQNKFANASKRYSCLPKGASITEGALQGNTLDHKFELILTDSFNEGAKSNLSDSLQVQRVQELQDNMLLIYRDLQTYKSSLNTGVLIVNELNISEAEFLEEEKVCIIRAIINIKYKV